MHELFEILTDDTEGGNIVSVQGDYGTRTGLTRQPMTRQDVTKNIPITHAYIRALSYVESIIYHVNAKVKIMGKGKRKTQQDRDNLQKAKENFRVNATNGKLHMKLDQPDCSGHGGKSDTAQMARAFFSPEKQEHVIDLFEGTDEEKANLNLLLKNLSLILKIISTKSKEIDVHKFENFCITTYLHLAQSFPWTSIPPSIHRILAHSAEKIKMNDNYGLGAFSEEGLESTHKLVRRFRSLLARKTSLSDNLRDVFKHLWIRTDPVIRGHARELCCTYCGTNGHTKRSCSSLRAGCSTETKNDFQSFFVSK